MDVAYPEDEPDDEATQQNDMKSHAALRSEEAREAGREAGKGAIVGAAKWGAAFVLLSGAGFALSPIYRGLTIQFKVYVGREDALLHLLFGHSLPRFTDHGPDEPLRHRYIQMSGMILGGWIEADRRLRLYEERMRLQKTLAAARQNWDEFERMYPQRNEEDK